MDTKIAGSLGGQKTKEIYGNEHFKKAQVKSVLARKRNKKSKLSQKVIHTLSIDKSLQTDYTISSEGLSPTTKPVEAK